MSGADVSRLARIYCLVTKMNLLLVRVEGMKAFNKTREMNGMSLGYSEEHFNDQETCLSKISDAIELEDKS